MSETLTRKDIDDVIGIIGDFMKQVDEKFDYSEQRAKNFEKKWMTDSMSWMSNTIA